MLAYDTRPSAEELVKAAGSGVQALGGLPIVCGRLTTPQLHWMVSASSSLGRSCIAPRLSENRGRHKRKSCWGTHNLVVPTISTMKR